MELVRELVLGHKKNLVKTRLKLSKLVFFYMSHLTINQILDRYSKYSSLTFCSPEQAFWKA